jgi:hypothetical protein
MRAVRVKGQISYDLVMEDDMAFAEGTFRLEGGEWQVFIFNKDPIQEPITKLGHFDSGVAGVTVKLPDSDKLNKRMVTDVLAQLLGVEEWQEVRGPDSMQLR